MIRNVSWHVFVTCIRVSNSLPQSRRISGTFRVRQKDGLRSMAFADRAVLIRGYFESSKGTVILSNQRVSGTALS